MAKSFGDQNQENEIVEPNQNFFSWLRLNSFLYTGQIFGTLYFIGFIISLVFSIYKVPEVAAKVSSSRIQIITFVLTIIIITYFIYKLISLIDNNGTGAYRSYKTYKKVFKTELSPDRQKALLKKCQVLIRAFKVYFLWFWISMLGLYAFFTYQWYDNRDHKKEMIIIKPFTVSKTYIESEAIPPKNYTQRITKSDTITNVRISMSGSLPDSISTENFERDPEFISHSAIDAIKILWVKYSIFILNTIGMMFIFWCFLILDVLPIDFESKARQNKLRNLSIFFTCMLIVLYPLTIVFSKTAYGYTVHNVISHAILFNAIGGTLNAIMIALLIARMDSKFIGLPAWLISVLYVYAAVQPLMVVFEAEGEINEIIKTGALVTVFLIKIHFFLIILYALQSGRILNYLYCYPTFKKRIDSIFENNFEISIMNDKGFYFIITKEKQKIYSSDFRFDHRDDCLGYIVNLQNEMEKEQSYSIKEMSGTFWIEVSNEENTTKCISLNLKSKNDAVNLMMESIEKIPNCKFNYT